VKKGEAREPASGINAEKKRHGQDSTGDTRLHGRWLVLAWLTWVILVMLYLGSL
jgi:hypothetical protein